MSHTHEYHTHDYLPNVPFDGTMLFVLFIVAVVAAAVCWFPWGDNSMGRQPRVIYVPTYVDRDSSSDEDEV
tara:strand:+ start:234 stop:446 length:213 start_codon:yes stop_codon:yes gene_type:complete